MILTATINEVKRRILFDNPQAVVAVKGDYEVNGIAFAFPAIYEDDFDLSTAVKTVYYKATDGIIYDHVVTATDTDTGYPLWVFKDEINKGAYGDVEFALVCDKVEGGNIVKRWVSMITAFRVQKSIEIDESEQEENEQTYSERLAYLMTQMASMQATVSGLASGAPTPESLVANMQEGRIYVYTGTETGYTAGHVYYYVGGVLTDGGVYGGTAVDATLTQSGEAADAAVAGAEISAIKEDLSTITNVMTRGNIFPAVTIAETVRNGVTYSAKDGWYSFDGTASTTFLIDIPGLPSRLASGHRYLFNTGGFNGAVYLRLTDTNNNHFFQKARSQFITIPAGTVVKLARFYIATSRTADNIRIKPTIALADVISDDAPTSALTIIDDDGAIGFYNDVLPIIQAKNVPIATSVIPTYASSSSINYMRWSHVEECYLNGAEVLCHTYDHSDKPEQEAKPETQIQREFQMAKNIFSKRGYYSNILVYAGGTGNLHKVYNAGFNTFPYAFNSGIGLSNYAGSIDPHNIYRVSVTYDLDALKAQIDNARSTRGCWLVWMFHTSAGEWSSANATILSNAIDYARSVGLDIITADAGCRRFVKDA